MTKFFKSLRMQNSFCFFFFLNIISKSVLYMFFKVLSIRIIRSSVEHRTWRMRENILLRGSMVHRAKEFSCLCEWTAVA